MHNIRLNDEQYEYLQGLIEAGIDAYDDLKRLTNYHFTDDPNPIKKMVFFLLFWGWSKHC